MVNKKGQPIELPGEHSMANPRVGLGYEKIDLILILTHLCVLETLFEVLAHITGDVFLV